MANKFPCLWINKGILILIQSYYGRVFSRFDDGIGGMDGVAVVGEEGVEEAAEDTALWCASVKDESR